LTKDCGAIEEGDRERMKEMGGYGEKVTLKEGHKIGKEGRSVGGVQK
jgi:hypothetical protein